MPSFMSRPENLRPSQLPLWWLLKSISLLPFPVLYALSTFLYVVLYYVIGYRKKVVRQNLANAFPHTSAAERLKIEKQFFLNLTDIIMETFKLVSLSPAALSKRVNVRNREAIDACLAKGNAVMVIGAHLGNWEYMSTAGNALFHYPVDGVYKPLSSSFFEAYMRFMRGGSELR